MKCNKDTELVCTDYEKCNNAWNCNNVPIGIKEKIVEEKFDHVVVKVPKKGRKSKRVKRIAR